MSTTERTFDSLGIDAITGVQLMDSLGISISELSIPQRFHRFSDVISFLKQYPEDTQRLLISKAVRGKSVDRLDHMFEYVNLLRQKAGYEETLRSVMAEISALETTGYQFPLDLVKNKESEVRGKINQISDEIGIYEK